MSSLSISQTYVDVENPRLHTESTAGSVSRGQAELSERATTVIAEGWILHSFHADKTQTFPPKSALYSMWCGFCAAILV